MSKHIQAQILAWGCSRCLQPRYTPWEKNDSSLDDGVGAAYGRRNNRLKEQFFSLNAKKTRGNSVTYASSHQKNQGFVWKSGIPPEMTALVGTIIINQQISCAVLDFRTNPHERVVAGGQLGIWKRQWTTQESIPANFYHEINHVLVKLLVMFDSSRF